MLLAFDFDGVIADSLAHNLETTNRNCAGRGNGRVFTAADIEELESMSFKELGVKLGVDDDERLEIQTATLAQLPVGIEAVRPFEDIGRTLDILSRGATLAIVSSSTNAVIRPFLKKYGFDSFFTKILTFDEPGAKAEKLNALAAEFAVPKSAMFMIGDAVSDIKAAQKAGVKSVAVSWGFQSAARLATANPDITIDSPAELIEQLLPAEYSVIIPAYNEEMYLPATLTAIRKAMAKIDQPGEIVVVDNNSTDNTARLAADFGAKVVMEPVNQISRARNAGAAAAAGRHLIFIDADTIIDPDLLNSALMRLERGDCCGGGSLVAFDRPVNFYAENFLRMWTWVSRNLGVAAGSFIFCLREAFEEIGGFNEKVYAGEELFFSRSLKTWGRRRGMSFSVIEECSATTSARKLEWFSTSSMIAFFLLTMVFPFTLRSRKMCRLWYHRPHQPTDGR